MPIILNSFIQHNENLHDTTNWTPTENGKFTLASALNKNRKKHS